MKIALRQLLKSPGFTVIALLTLALAIGVNTTQFTVLNRLLFQGPPFPEVGRLVQIWRTTPQGGFGAIAPGDFLDFREQSNAFAHLAAYYLNYQGSLALPGATPERATVIAVAADYFSVLGVGPLLGRTFTADDETRQLPLVVLSHAYWRKNFGADPAALGRTLRLDGKTMTIVGVMPPVLDDPRLWNARVDLWNLDPVGVNRQVRNNAWYSLFGRLKPGVTPAQAEAELKGIAARLAHDFPATNDQRSVRVDPFTIDNLGEEGRRIVWLLMGLAGAVLLIACVNLANLQLVRATGRSREYAIRLALGASRRQLMGQLLRENLLLALAGGLLGLLVAQWGDLYFARFFEFAMPLNQRVLGFTLVISLVTGIASALLPAWFGTRAGLQAALKQGGPSATTDRSRHRLRQGLIVVELALALTLLTGAGFFIRGLQRIIARDLHWRPDNVLTGNFSLAYERYGDDPNPRHAVFTEKFLTALRQLPGVDQAGLSIGSPAYGPSAGLPLQIEGQTALPKGQEPVAMLCRQTPGYFQTWGIQLLQGRDFSATDTLTAPPVAVISQSMAAKFWPGETPLGKRFRSANDAPDRWIEVVGVVADIAFATDYAGQIAPYHVYRPWAQASTRFITFSLHTTSDPRTLDKAVRQALAQIEPDVAIPEMNTAQGTIDSLLKGFALVRQVLIALAVLGLLLSAVGIYGVIATLTSERTQEVGIRMALGAGPDAVLWLFLRNGLQLALLGAAFGLLLSFALMRGLTHALAIVPGNDPWMIGGLALGLIAIALFASWLPARRATKVDPVIALRSE